MNYEKKYKEALERARKLEENSNGMILKKWLWNIFPELKESGDEKNLRRAIRATKVVYPVAADWLQSLQDRVGCEANCTTTKEWSEEDEELVKWSIHNLTELKDRYGEEYGKVGKCIDWLQSLRPQNHWKPTDEQMGCLSDAIEHYNSLGYPASKLKELYEQLKKL